MLDIRRLRENPDEIQAQAKAKGVETDIRAILALDDRRKEILAEVEELKARRNAASKKIGELKRTGGDAQAAMDEVASIKGRIDELDGQQGEVEAKIREAMSYIPNVPQPGVPEGKSSEDNVEVRVWGDEPADDFERIDHKFDVTVTAKKAHGAAIAGVTELVTGMKPPVEGDTFSFPVPAGDFAVFEVKVGK